MKKKNRMRKSKCDSDISGTQIESMLSKLACNNRLKDQEVFESLAGGVRSLRPFECCLISRKLITDCLRAWLPSEMEGTSRGTGEDASSMDVAASEHIEEGARSSFLGLSEGLHT